jgi:hypothetical protein
MFVDQLRFIENLAGAEMKRPLEKVRQGYLCGVVARCLAGHCDIR